MKPFLLGLTLALASCVDAPQQGGRPFGSVAGPADTEQAKILKEKKINAAPEKAAPPSAPVPNKHVDLYVYSADPNSKRELVSYLSKPEDWVLLKFESLSPTLKHYRFMGLEASNDRRLQKIHPSQPHR
jgi:hypothetical protein